MEKTKIIVIVGPTASGKSDLAIKIAKKYAKIQGTEIISADSRQVYRGMDIGTGKVTKKERKIVKHHLIDISDPKKQFTASDFKRLGDKAIKEMWIKDKIPIIVGGTGFYIDVLLGRMQTAEVKPNKKLRAKLEKQSTEHLFIRLQKLDPSFSEIIDRHNRHRLIRALEIVIKTGKPVPRTVTNQSTNYDVLWLGLNPSDLKERIEKRLDQRLKQGMVKEVENLIRQGISNKRLEKFGLEYKWVSLYLSAYISYKDMRQNLLKDIINYSKRQMTWFKKNKDINWIALNKTGAIKEPRKIENKIAAFLGR